MSKSLRFLTPVCVGAAVVPLLPGRAADAHLPGPGAGSPGLQDASEAADGGAERPEGAETATGGAGGQGGPRAPPVGAEGRALPLPAQRGPETGEPGPLRVPSLRAPPTQRLTVVFTCLAAGLPEQAGAAAGGGGGEEAEEGVEGGAADEGAEPEGAAACANIQVGVGLS